MLNNHLDQQLISSCCGASCENIDYKICPDCKEHCEFEKPDTLENEINSEVEGIISTLKQQRVELDILIGKAEYPSQCFTNLAIAKDKIGFAIIYLQNLNILNEN